MNFTPAQLFALEKETLLTIALATAAGSVLCGVCCCCSCGCMVDVLDSNILGLLF
jgi:hypothetical protein